MEAYFHKMLNKILIDCVQIHFYTIYYVGTIVDIFLYPIFFSDIELYAN